MHFTLSQIIIGILMTGAGLAGVKYTLPVLNFTGNLYWIERYTGTGSTFLILKLFFLLMAVVGILTATGLIGPVVLWVFSPLKSVFHPGI
jgi:hypothetical protein